MASISGVVWCASVCGWSAVWSMWCVMAGLIAIIPVCGIWAPWATPVVVVIIPKLCSGMASICIMMTWAAVSVEMWLWPGMTLPVPVLIAVSGAWHGMVGFVWFWLMLCWGSWRRYPMWAIHYNVTILITFKTPNVGAISCYLFDTMLTIDGGVMVAVSCTAFSFFTLDIALLTFVVPSHNMQVARLWAFFKHLMNILIVTTSFVKLHLLASVFKWCTYAVRDPFSHCWISMNHKVYVWILALRSFSHNRSFISSQDLFEVMASVTSVCIKPLDFALASLALLSLVRSTVVSMSVSQSSNLVESCSVKTAISCSKEFVRLDCFCVEQKVSVYCSITSPRGSVGVGGCGWWMAINRFLSSCCMQYRVSAGCPSAATLWCK